MAIDEIYGGNAATVLARLAELTWNLLERHWLGTPHAADPPVLDDRGLRFFWLCLLRPELTPAAATATPKEWRRIRHSRRVLLMPLQLLHPEQVGGSGRNLIRERKEEFEQRQLDGWLALMTRRLELANASAVPPRLMADLATFAGLSECSPGTVNAVRDARPPFPEGHRPAGRAMWAQLADRIEHDLGADGRARKPYGWRLSRPADNAGARLPEDLGLADIAMAFRNLIPLAQRTMFGAEIRLARKIEAEHRAGAAADRLSAGERTERVRRLEELKQLYQNHQADYGGTLGSAAGQAGKTTADSDDPEIFAWLPWVEAELRKFPVYSAFRQFVRVIGTLNDAYARCYSARLDPWDVFEFEDAGGGIAWRHVGGTVPTDMLKRLAKLEQGVDRERLEQAVRPALTEIAASLARSLDGRGQFKAIKLHRQLLCSSLLRERLSRPQTALRRAWERVAAALAANAGKGSATTEELSTDLTTLQAGLADPAISFAFELDDIAKLRDAPFWSWLLRRVGSEWRHYARAWDRLPADKQGTSWKDFVAAFESRFGWSPARIVERGGRRTAPAFLEEIPDPRGPDQDRVGEPMDPGELMDLVETAFLNALGYFLHSVMVDDVEDVDSVRQQLQAFWQRGPQPGNLPDAPVLTADARRLIKRATYAESEAAFETAIGRKVLSPDFLRNRTPSGTVPMKPKGADHHG